MKSVIDIPIEYYEAIKKIPVETYTVDMLIIANSKPLDSVLDEIRAEIERIVDEEQKHDEKWAIGLRYAVKIIDKYSTESEEKHDSRRTD